MVLNIAMTILLSIDMGIYVDYAQELLKYFVQNFELIYGKHFVSHNVHALIHITDDNKNYGPLDNISAFPFENYMKTLKKMLKNMSYHFSRLLNAIIKRLILS